MRESRDEYIIRKIREERMKEALSVTVMTEIDIDKKNIADLQEQLQNSYIKQKLFLDKLNELQRRRIIALVGEREQLDFDFKPSDKK